MVFSLFQRQITYPRDHSGIWSAKFVPHVRLTLANIIEDYVGNSASISHRRIHSRIHSREQCCMFLDCGKISSEFMPFFILNGMCIQDALIPGLLINMEPLAPKKAAMHTEALCPQDIHNSSVLFLQSCLQIFHVEFQIFDKA